MTSPAHDLTRRSCGVLLHPTSLPSPYGIGDLGPNAFAWVDALARGKQRWWQTLPLGPTGYGDSPYQSFSSFAGNPLLISPELLIQEGLLDGSDWAEASFPAHEVDYGAVLDFKSKVLETAWLRFKASAGSALHEEQEHFQNEQEHWLNDYATFMAIKESRNGQSWQDWPTELAQRNPSALTSVRKELHERIGFQKFRQFLFFRQWNRLLEHAHRQGVYLIGDAPIFVAGDSADVWSQPQWFLLDEHRQPQVVAGVPPDYFSPTGQLWGNPLYDWDALRLNGYRWWIDRLRATLSMVDVLRLDHFRGFAAAWHVPADAETAEGGKWVLGPGADFFVAVQKALGGLPLIAEDLGEITPDVHELRDLFRLPGMRVLHFAFEGKPDNPFLPHMYEPNSVVYTGTHDNDTTLGWYGGLPEHEKEFFWRYLDRPAKEGGEVAWDLIRVAWSSSAATAIVPLQDLLTLDTSARMNFPGRPGGNWRWRYTPEAPLDDVLGRLHDLTWLYNRMPEEPE